MDPTQLLNTLYSPSSTPEARKDAELKLLAFQRSPEGLSYVNTLLANDDNSRFYAIMTIQIHLITTEYKPSLSDLLQIYTTIKSSPVFVLRKFALVLATLGLKLNPEQFLDTIYNSTQSVPLTLFVATDLVNESDKIHQNRFKNHSILFCKSNAPFVIQLIQQCLEHMQYSEEATLCFTAWLDRFDESQIQLIYNKLLQMLANPNPEHLEDLTSEHVLSLISEQSEDVSSWLKMLVGIGEDMTDYLVKNVLSNSVQQYFQILLKLTDTPGIYAIDEELSEEPLFIWTYIQEAVTEPSSHLCKLIAVDYPDYDPSRFEIPGQIYNKFEEIYQALLPILLKKMAVDPDAFRNKPKDTLNTFAVYRHSLTDAVQDVYKITPTYTMSWLLEKLNTLMANDLSKQQDLESVLRAFANLSEFAEDDVNINKLFDPALLLKSLQYAQLDKWLPVHQQYLNCIKQYSAWFEKNNNNTVVTAVIEYVMQLLQHPKLQHSTIHAIKGLCNALPNHMIQYSGTLLQNLQIFNADIQTGILQALSSTTDALEIKDKLMALTIIMKHILKGLQEHQKEQILMMKWIYCFEVVINNYPLSSEIQMITATQQEVIFQFMQIVDESLLTTMMCVSQYATDVELSSKFSKIIGPLCGLLRYDYQNIPLDVKSINELPLFLYQWWQTAPCSECLESFHKLIKSQDNAINQESKKTALTSLATILLDSSKFSNPYINVDDPDILCSSLESFSLVFKQMDLVELDIEKLNALRHNFSNIVLFGLKSDYRNVCSSALATIILVQTSLNGALQQSLNTAQILQTLFIAIKTSLPLDKYLIGKACQYIQLVLRQNPEPYLSSIPKDLNLASLDVKSIRLAILEWSGRNMFESTSFNS